MSWQEGMTERDCDWYQTGLDRGLYVGCVVGAAIVAWGCALQGRASIHIRTCVVCGERANRDSIDGWPVCPIHK